MHAKFALSMEFQGCTVSSSGLGQGRWLLPCQVNGFLIHDSMEGNSSTYGCPYAGSKVAGMHPISRVTLTEQKSFWTSVMSLVDLAVDFFSRISVILLVIFLFYFLKQIFSRFCSTMISAGARQCWLTYVAVRGTGYRKDRPGPLSQWEKSAPVN